MNTLATSQQAMSKIHPQPVLPFALRMHFVDSHIQIDLCPVQSCTLQLLGLYFSGQCFQWWEVHTTVDMILLGMGVPLTVICLTSVSVDYYICSFISSLETTASLPRLESLATKEWYFVKLFLLWLLMMGTYPVPIMQYVHECMRSLFLFCYD